MHINSVFTLLCYRCIYLTPTWFIIVRALDICKTHKHHHLINKPH